MGPGPVVLILGGTAEARELAGRLAADGRLRWLTALAGRTRDPVLPPGKVRIGGFGGIDGLAAFLGQQGVTAVVDATHPFATRMTTQAIAATRALGLPYLRLERRAWRAEPGDRWHEVADIDAAVRLLPSVGRRVLAAVGRQTAAALPDVPGLFWLVRSIERPARLPANAAWLRARGPFTLAAERDLLVGHRIDAVLAKASGGEGARAKLLAARELGLPVVLLARPPVPPDVACVTTPAEAVAWLERLR